MHRLLLPFLSALLIAGCGSDALDAGRRAMEREDWLEAIQKLRPVVTGEGGNEDVAKLYTEALKGHRAELRGPRTKVETCDAAFTALTEIEGFGSTARETTLLSQALLCSARNRARSKQVDAAVTHVVDAMDRHPGFGGGSPVLAKALAGPAEAAARAGKVREATALAQVLFGSGKQGLALSLLDLLDASGADPEAIYQALNKRYQGAKTSDAAAGITAGYGAWHGHPDDAARMYDGVVRRMGKAAAASEAKTQRYAKARAEEAQGLADSRRPECVVLKSDISLAVGVGTIGAAASAPVEGGAVVAWMQGEKAPDQQVVAVRVGFAGEKGPAVTVAHQALPPQKAAPDDPRGAFAPKNRETALALVPCGGTIEVAARGAPQAGWMRATLKQDATVGLRPTAVGNLGEAGRMPSEDVWWNIGCSGDKLVHVWLADTQLMRLAFFSAGEPEGDPTNVRLAGFAPWFHVRGGEEGATLLTWIDIVGEGASQIVWTSIDEERAVSLAEEENHVAAQPAVEGIDGRVEHMRVERMGERYALVYVPQGGDFGIRWIHPSGRPLGQGATLIPMRSDARDVRFDASGGGNRLGVAWTERLTEDWSALFFHASNTEGADVSRMQRLAGLVRPEVSPMVVGGEGGLFIVAWIDRSAPRGEGVNASVLHCR